MTSSLSRFVAFTSESGGDALSWHPLVYGLVALSVFALLLGVLWSFRNTGGQLSKSQRDQHSQH